MIKQLSRIENILEKSNSVLIVSHEDPDGDSIGSALALSQLLDKLKIRNTLFCIHPVPKIYQFLPKAKQFSARTNEIIDTIVAVDCSDLKRLKVPQEILAQAKYIINIDHHPDNTRFGDLNLIETCAATAEIIYQLINLFKIGISADMATCLYVAILTDTGNFIYENTTAGVFAAVLALVEAGANPYKIAQKIYEAKSLSSIKLLRDALNTYKFSGNGKIAWTVVTSKMMKKNKAKPEELAGIVDILRSINGVEVAILFREIDKSRKVKINFRSKSINIQPLAQRFGGGGHFKAAGAVAEGKINTVKNRVLKETAKLF